MSIPEEKKPIYHDRVNEIIRSLNDGISRDELAIKYKHSDYKSLDMYMCRRNFTWDSKAKNYKPVITRVGKNKFLDEDLHTGKVSRIMNLFTEGKDPKTVAEELGFKDHKAFAAFMTQKG